MFALFAILGLAGLVAAVGRGASGGRTTPPAPGAFAVDANGFRVFRLAAPDVIEIARDNAPGGLWLLVDLVDAGGAIWRTIVGPSTPGGGFTGRPYAAPHVAPASYPFDASEVAVIVGYVAPPDQGKPA